MCDELLAEIDSRNEFKNFEQARIQRAKEETGQEVLSNMHIMVYDIIYCAHAYSFYTGMSIKKSSTKDRIKRAAERDARDKLETELAQVKVKIKEVKSKMVDIVIPAGSIITHKKFGEGVVKEVSDGHIVVSYGDTDKTFQYPGAFENGFLKLTDVSVMTELADNTANQNELKELQRQLSVLESKSNSNR